MTLNSTTTGSLGLSPLLIHHLQNIEELCKKEATVHPRTLLVQTQTRRKQGGLANGAEAEDEDDFMEDVSALLDNINKELCVIFLSIEQKLNYCNTLHGQSINDDLQDEKKK